MTNASKNSYFPLLLSFTAAALLLGAPAYAQEKTGEVDKVFGWATAATPGCAVAVSQRGKLVVNRAYGSADLEREVPLSAGSVFDIGSVRKQFVAAAVLLLVEDGRLSLTDDIRKHFPELPDYGHKVTVDHLLTHTSGVRDWQGLRPLTGGGNVDVVSLTLRQRGLNFAPGEEWSYSNSGYVLLTDLVARASGMSFPDFTRKRLFEPLGMKTTASPRDLREVIRNRALGYVKEGDGWRAGMYVGNERGSDGGAIISTAADLVTWNEALNGGRLGAFVTEKLQEGARLNNGRKLGYARGLFVDSYRGGAMVWHSGSAAGYSAWLGRLPAHGLSVAVLCNEDAASATALARRVADQFLPAAGAGTAEAKPPAAVADGAGVTGPNLDGKAGLFLSEGSGDPLLLVVNKGELRIPGLRAALVPVAKDRFRNPSGDLNFMSQDEFELHFLSQDEFELKSMEGKTTRYRRARPYAPTAAELQDFAGRYTSDETGSAFKIVPGKDGLVVHLEGSSGKGSEIRPVYRDAFQVSRVTVRFRRDNAGKVVAFDYSNPLIRNLRFTRQSDGTARP